MDLAFNRYSSEVINIIQDVAESHFVAFDLEFSGINGPSQQRTSGKPSLQELYAETKIAATKYQVLQVGFTVVKEDLENGQYIVKPYNFNISPLPLLRERQFSRDWSMSSGAVQFLLRNRFDFGLPFTHGIPYLSRAEEIQARMGMSGENDRKRPDMVLKPEDENLIKHIRTSIAAWQEEPEESRESYINIPNDSRGKGVPGALNRYQVRLTHQVVQNEFGNLKTTSMQNFVQVTNPTKAERERQKTLQKEYVDREIGRATGFRWILEAMAGRDISGMPDECFLSAIDQFPKAKASTTPFRRFVSDLNEDLIRRRRVLVGHNCFTDLVFLHQFFLGELPNRVEDFQDSINDLFPAVIDTKHMASFGSARWGDTSLAAVEEDLRDEKEPKIHIPPGFDRYSSNEKPHEAGYDALLTATIAIKLSAKMEREAIYLDQDNPDDAVSEIKPRTEPFGTKEEGYVTACEDLDSLLSEKSVGNEFSVSGLETHTEGVEGSEAKDDVVRHLSPETTPKQDTFNTPNPDSTGVVAVKEKKPKPIKPAEVARVRSSFAVVNIYDVLDKEQESKSDEGDLNEDLMSFSDPDSPLYSTNQAKTNVPTRAEVQEMVKKGQLMPRWDGGNGFWQIFGNKLQVNSCKEGVCEL